MSVRTPSSHSPLLVSSPPLPLPSVSTKDAIGRACAITHTDAGNTRQHTYGETDEQLSREGEMDESGLPSLISSPLLLLLYTSSLCALPFSSLLFPPSPVFSFSFLLLFCLLGDNKQAEQTLDQQRTRRRETQNNTDYSLFQLPSMRRSCFLFIWFLHFLSAITVFPLFDCLLSVTMEWILPFVSFSLSLRHLPSFCFVFTLPLFHSHIGCCFFPFSCFFFFVFVFLFFSFSFFLLFILVNFFCSCIRLTAV